LREQIDVHKVRQRYDRARSHLHADQEISERNKDMILKFVQDLQAEGITLTRLLKYLFVLPQLAKRLKKDFDRATIIDIKKLVAEINNSDYADWTKGDFRIGLKRFYRWLRHLPEEQDPPETAWIRIGNGFKQVLPEELLTEDDIAKLVEACENSRDRALVLCTYETGGRIGELLNLRRKHVQFDEYGAVLMFSGKTGDRRVRVIAAAPALAQWLNDSPVKNPESPLWVIIGDRNHGEPLLYDSVRFLLRSLGKKCGLQKKVNPHAFRHARASFLANNLTERQMEQYLGWAPGSKMPKVYVHLSGRDVDSALLRMHGIETDAHEVSRPKLSPVKCPRCNQSNGAESFYCCKCGLPLHLAAALEAEHKRSEADRLMSALLDDAEVRQVILSKLRKLDFSTG
jgi:integrase/recombinase XerD